MTRRERISKKFVSLMYNHLWLKYIFEYGFAFIASIVSAAIFAFGLNVFLDPTVLPGCTGTDIGSMVSGGSSGLSQTINMIFILCGAKFASGSTIVFSVAYVCINVPLVIIAFKGIGKRFGLFTLVNVLFVSIFTNLFRFPFLAELAIEINHGAGLLARALFAGMCTGLSSAIAFKIESSAGGFDIIGYYISLKKSTSVGPYVTFINSFTITAYAILKSLIENNWAKGLSGIFFSLVYLLTSMLVVDVINVRNKKSQIQIITNNKDLPKLLLAYIPHGATLVNAKGAYSNTDKTIIYMVVSFNEVKKTIKTIKKIDPESFVNVTTLEQVYGRFHMKRVK